MSYVKRYQPADIKNGRCPNCNSSRLLYQGGKVKCDNCGTEIGRSFSKYGAKKQEINGRIYDSKFEAGGAIHYDTLLKAGEIKEVIPQFKIPLEAYGKHIFNYYIDFLIIHLDGHKEYVEYKGYETDLWKAKWKMLGAKLALEEPTSEMTLLKQSNFAGRRR